MVKAMAEQPTINFWSQGLPTSCRAGISSRHGRNAFNPESARHVRLCHVDRDEFHGQLRDLGGRLGRSGYGWALPAGAHPA